MTGFLGDVAAVVVVALFFATLNKALLDLCVAPIRRKFPTADLWWFDYVALATGILLAWLFNINLLSAFQTGEPSRIGGLILTGLAIGGGADLINDLFAGVQGRKVTALDPGVMADAAPTIPSRQSGW